MPITPEGYWIPNLSAKQFELFNCQKRFILATGPRKSSKTVACLHKLLRHAWEVPGAKVGMFGRTLKNLMIGPYDELCSKIIPQWEDGLDGFEVMKHGVDGTTRMPFIRIRSIDGTPSEIQVHSLDDENRIAEKVKATLFTCVFVSELTNFKMDRVFRTLIHQLRGVGVKQEQTFMLADTNPSEEEGVDSWIYKLWYDERLQEEHKYPSFQKQLHVIEFDLDSNPFISEDEKNEIRASFAHDPDLFAAMVEGRWIRTAAGSLYQNIFSKERHVIGDISGPHDDWEVMLPSESATMLYTGWDPGSVNNSIHFMEKIVDSKGDVTWCVLDEVVHIDAQLSLEEITLEVCDKMDEIDQLAGRKFHWVHWSDSSAESFKAAAGMMESMIVAKASGGRIQLQMADKAAGSVRMRANLVRQLLQKDKLFVSAQCEWTIGMLNGGLKRGTRKNEFIKRNAWLHPFDSMSYPIISEAPFDLTFSGTPSATKRSGVINVEV